MKTTIIKTTIPSIIITLALALAGCGKNGSGSSSSSGGAPGDPDKTAFSIKYKTGDGIIIFTKNESGTKIRLDDINVVDGREYKTIYVWDRRGGADKNGIVYQYSEGAWTEMPRLDGDSINMAAIRIEQTVNNYYSDPVRELTKFYTNPQVGFTKQPSQTIAGKSCDVYKGVRPKGSSLPRYSALYLSGAEEEIAVWNGLTMRLKNTRTLGSGAKEENLRLEAQAVTFRVPDSAFTKTPDTNWIK